MLRYHSSKSNHLKLLAQNNKASRVLVLKREESALEVSSMEIGMMNIQGLSKLAVIGM